MTIFRKILLWFGAMLLFSLAGYSVATNYVGRRGGGQFGRVFEMQNEDARNILQSGGPRALDTFLRRTDRYFAGRHYFLNASGRDLVSGADRSDLLRAQHKGPPGMFERGPFVFANASPDGKYFFVADGAMLRFDPLAQLPYYAANIIVLVFLSYILAVSLATPLKELRETLARFGSGDLSARTGSRRGDEFGELGRAFDKMADRIQTLVTAERRLLQDISHELRSPLARLQFAAELARTSNDRGAAVDRIKKEVARLTQLVGELIEVTRAEGDPGEHKTDLVDLGDLIDHLAEDCRIEAQAIPCEIVTDPHPDGLMAVLGDSEMIRRAVENVLRNAIRHSPGGSKIVMSLESRNGSALIGIRDHGSGVPEETLSQIFRPFFRVEDDRSRDSGGMGIGLAIAQRAVRVHHGEIRAANQNPGLLVTIELPLASRPR